MPTVFRVDGMRFFFYSNEKGEPPHVHVEVDGGVAKFWLQPVSFAGSRGIRVPKIHRIRAIVETHCNRLLEAWHDHFE